MPWAGAKNEHPRDAKTILEGKPIRVFNNGEMWRDFTCIDDIVDGVVSVLDARAKGSPPHRIFNIGNNRPCKLVEKIGILENLLGRKAKRVYETMQPGDVERTYAEIEDAAGGRYRATHRPRGRACGVCRMVSWLGSDGAP
jgi:UDP-glucuronate 4-epimerase